MAKRRLEQLFLDHVGVVIPRSKIEETAEITRWFQRISELRIEKGYNIIARDNGYILISHNHNKPSSKRRSRPSKHCQQLIRHRDNDACVYCCKPTSNKLQFDHITPYKSGTIADPHNPDHWQLLCSKHNLMKRDDVNYETNYLNYLIQTCNDINKLTRLKCELEARCHQLLATKHV